MSLQVRVKCMREALSAGWRIFRLPKGHAYLLILGPDEELMPLVKSAAKHLLDTGTLAGSSFATTTSTDPAKPEAS